MKWNAIEFTGIVLFIIGFYGLISRRKVVKSILSLGVMDVRRRALLPGDKLQAWDVASDRKHGSSS